MLRLLTFNRAKRTSATDQKRVFKNSLYSGRSSETLAAYCCCQIADIQLMVEGDHPHTASGFAPATDRRCDR